MPRNWTIARVWPIALLPLVSPVLNAGSLYAGPRICAACHPAIAKTYSQTGMGRSFFRLTPDTTIEDFTGKNRYYHTASDTYYEMLRRKGMYFQRRYQLGPDHQPTNIDEKKIDFVIGSGNHARTYLHLTARGTLMQLPLAWYSERGGFWAMSPGYDSPNHPDNHRVIGYDCMFCHNAYPQTPGANDRFATVPRFTGAIPEGIDCERCHGPGQQHVANARRPGAKLAQIRQSILNPARLSPERELEVCMQCHLEPNSSIPLRISSGMAEVGSTTTLVSL